MGQRVRENGGDGGTYADFAVDAVLAKRRKKVDMFFVAETNGDGGGEVVGQRRACVPDRGLGNR